MADINNQTEYWDRVAWEKVFSLPLDAERFASLVSPDQRILDYGCGYGRTCAELWDLGYWNVVGADSSPMMIERARQEHPQIDFQVLDGALPFDDGSIDAVILFATLTCIPTDDGQLAVMQDVRRVLSPGGILCLSDFPLQTAERNRAVYREYESRFGVYGTFELPDGGIVRHHDPRWIGRLTSGFEKLHAAEIDVLTMNGNPARAFQYFGRKPGG